ncbi:MAG TPA: hypothetical protein ENI69_10140 [Rhodospirillales bacterium]|nr:hypothetical protein [Rhodospirillales bacterium]
MKGIGFRKAGPYQALTSTNCPVVWVLDWLFDVSEGATSETPGKFSFLPATDSLPAVGAGTGSGSFCTGSLINSLFSMFLATATRANNEVTLATLPELFPLMSIVLMYQHFYSKKSNRKLLHGEYSIKTTFGATIL